jgi:hypothetical protein
LSFPNCKIFCDKNEDKSFEQASSVELYLKNKTYIKKVERYEFGAGKDTSERLHSLPF